MTIDATVPGTATATAAASTEVAGTQFELSGTATAVFTDPQPDPPPPADSGVWVSPEGVTIEIDSAGGWTFDQIHQLLLENDLDLDVVGPSLMIKVQDVDLSSTATSASSSGGVYTSFNAIMYLKGVDSSFADKSDAILAHEYGHA